MAKLSNLSDAVVRAEDGTVDIDATLSDFASQVLALVEKEATLSDRIRDAVHAIFDANLGKTLPKPYVVATAIQSMAVTPDEYTETTKTINSWVSASPEFNVGKGKRGGVSRKRDIPPKADGNNKK